MKASNIILIGAGIYLASSLVRKKFNSIVDAVIPEPIRDIIGIGSQGRLFDYDGINKLKLYTDPISRDNIYLNKDVQAGRIEFPELLHEFDAKVKAGQIISANTRFLGDNDVWDNLLAWGISNATFGALQVDKPEVVVEVFGTIQNASQLMQVAYWYSRATGKLLSNGVKWMPASMLKQIYSKARTLGTGAYWSTNKQQLSFNEFKNILKKS